MARPGRGQLDEAAMTEQIDWIATAASLPDADETVLIFRPHGDEPVWLGYYSDDVWRTDDGWPVDVAVDPVTHWAAMPDGPQ